MPENTLPQDAALARDVARGREACELLPVNGKCLYDDERDVLAWALAGGNDALEVTVNWHGTTRGQVIAYALERLGTMRAVRLEAIARDRQPITRSMVDKAARALRHHDVMRHVDEADRRQVAGELARLSLEAALPAPLTVEP
jgi:hypothetical protein